jgi:predicted cupin superfamily sugar epimerase
MHPRAAELLRSLDLVPHPEGGFFREIFRSRTLVQPLDGRSRRSALTTIYFLLPAGTVSRWHAVASDEVWHLYEGGPLELSVASPDLEAIHAIQLSPAAAGRDPSATVPAGWWQAARPLGDYALAGCTVGPGFEYEDFRLLSDDPAAMTKLRARAPELLALA